jgi:predicted Zn-dependent peptidase
MKSLKRITLIIAVLFFTFTVYPQNKISNFPKGVSVHTLDNGLQVLLIENHALPMVGINTVVKVGSAYETFATSGMSHMLEHLLFNGTTTMNQRQLYNAVDMIGGYNNANTSEFYTNFMMVTPAENIEKGMKIQADMLFNSTLPINKYEKEKGIVLEEISKTLANPSEQLERNKRSVLYKNDALSLPTLGTYETIVHMQRDDVYKFYKNNYVPNNMMVSVIGNFNSVDMLKKLNDIYGKYSPSTVSRPNIKGWTTGSEIPEYKVNPGVYYKFHNGKDFHLQLFYTLPNGSDDEFYSLLDEKYSELATELTDKINGTNNNIVSNLNIGVNQTPIANHLMFDFTTSEKSSNAIIDFMKSEISKIKIKVNENEIAAKVAEEKTSFLRNIEKPHMFGIYNADLIAVHGFKPILEKFSGENYYTAAKEVNDFSLTGDPIIILQIPFNSVLSGNKGEEITTKDYSSKLGKPDIIVRTNKQSNLLAVHFLLGHKAEYENKFGANAAYIWHEAFGARVRKDAAKPEAAKFGFVFTVNDNPFIPMDDIYLSPDFGYIRAEGLGDDIEGAINFLKNEMLKFTPTEKEFKAAEVKYRRSQMMKHSNRAKSLFNSLLDSLIYNENSSTSSKEKLSYSSLLKFGERYFNPENMVVSVVSKASGDDVNNYFNGFGKSAPKDLITSPPAQKSFRVINKAVTITKNINSKRAYLFFGFMKTILPSEKAALKALSLILSDKISFDIRETQGLAYNMGAGIETRGDKAMFYINMGSRSENVNKLEKQFGSKFSLDYLGKITKEDLEKRLNLYLGRMLFRRLSSINQGFYLCKSYYYYHDYTIDENFLRDLRNVSLEEVKKVAEKYLEVSNPINIIVK